MRPSPSPRGTLSRACLLLLALVACGASDEADPANEGASANEGTSPESPASPTPGATPGASGPSADDAGPGTDGGTDAALADGGSKPTAPAVDLTNWKLTLPVAGASATSPKEVLQPALATFQLSPYFEKNPAGFFQFRAHAGGTTTSNSGYPRSELREMANAGREQASWSTTSGTHTMTIVQAITHAPVVKPHVVAGQIHDADDDVVMVRLEKQRLFVEAKGKDVGVLDPAYVLGTKFTVQVVAAQGRVKVSYNGAQKVDIARAATGCYFKAGVYTQSNPSKGDAATAYGETQIYALSVTHE